jgi:uncharacterized protein (UPF0332 family)
MMFNPQTFITVSRDLKAGNSEAHYRSSISRAYYGAFGHLREGLSIYVADQSVHQAVIDTLKRSKSLEYKKIGSRLEVLFKKRKEADYDYRRNINQNSCDYCINEARDIVDRYNLAEQEDE